MPVSLVAPVADAAARGAGLVMLRPEQLSLTADGPGPLVRVEEVEFGGAACGVTVWLPPGPPGSPERLVLRASPLALPPVGAVLHLAVAGEAHCLPG